MKQKQNKGSNQRINAGLGVDSSGLKPAQNDEMVDFDGVLRVDSSVAKLPQNDGYTKGQNDGHKGQSGRSFVEMLGTLAIMGVLSIGSIAGFNYAMNKHRATEVINEAKKRAVVASMKIMEGKRPKDVSLSEFTNNDLGYAQFKTTVSEGINIRQFNILLDGAPKEPVCQQMKAVVSKSSVVRYINDDCTKIVFNRDLGLDDQVDIGSCGSANTIYLSYAANPCTKVINPSVACTRNGECGGWGGCCIGGKCASDGGSGICPGIVEECVKNSDCAAGYFCAINQRTSGEMWGSCLPLDSGTLKPDTDTKIGDITYKAKTFLVGSMSNTLTWWASQNWCAAHGMRMVTLSDLQIKEPIYDCCMTENLCQTVRGHDLTSDNWKAIQNALSFGRLWTGYGYTGRIFNWYHHECITGKKQPTLMPDMPICVRE